MKEPSQPNAIVPETTTESVEQSDRRSDRILALPKVVREHESRRDLSGG